MNSFFSDGIKACNKVIVNFPNMPPINILKSHILSLIRPEKKSIFNIHDPLGLRYLFHLRVGLSPLRSHKNRHGFATYFVKYKIHTISTYATKSIIQVNCANQSIIHVNLGPKSTINFMKEIHVNLPKSINKIHVNLRQCIIHVNQPKVKYTSTYPKYNTRQPT